MRERIEEVVPPTIWYVVMRKQDWDAITLESNLPYPVHMRNPDNPDEPIGFLPVFDDREKAKKWADGAEIVLCKSVEK